MGEAAGAAGEAVERSDWLWRVGVARNLDEVLGELVAEIGVEFAVVAGRLSTVGAL